MGRSRKAEPKVELVAGTSGTPAAAAVGTARTPPTARMIPFPINQRRYLEGFIGQSKKPPMVIWFQKKFAR